MPRKFDFEKEEILGALLGTAAAAGGQYNALKNYLQRITNLQKAREVLAIKMGRDNYGTNVVRRAGEQGVSGQPEMPVMRGEVNTNSTSLYGRGQLPREENSYILPEITVNAQRVPSSVDSLLQNTPSAELIDDRMHDMPFNNRRGNASVPQSQARRSVREKSIDNILPLNYGQTLVNQALTRNIPVGQNTVLRPLDYTEQEQTVQEPIERTAETKQPSQTQASTNEFNPNLSVQDYFTSLGLDGSYETRAKFARNFGITDYRGTAAQNRRLMELMRQNVSQTETMTRVPAVGLDLDEQRWRNWK